MGWSEVKWWMSFKTHPRRRQIKQAAQQKQDWGQRTNVKGRQRNKLSMQRLAACVGKYYFMLNIWKAHHGLIMISKHQPLIFHALLFTLVTIYHLTTKAVIYSSLYGRTAPLLLRVVVNIEWGQNTVWIGAWSKV